MVDLCTSVLMKMSAGGGRIKVYGRPRGMRQGTMMGWLFSLLRTERLFWMKGKWAFGSLKWGTALTGRSIRACHTMTWCKTISEGGQRLRGHTTSLSRVVSRRVGEGEGAFAACAGESRSSLRISGIEVWRCLLHVAVRRASGNRSTQTNSLAVALGLD
jgi:hypothetical protein